MNIIRWFLKTLEALILNRMYGLVQGMDHLTAHGVVHRDLATRNLLLEIKRGGVHRVKVYLLHPPFFAWTI